MVLMWQGRGLVVLFILIAAGVAGIALSIFWIVPAVGIVDDDRAANLAIAVSTAVAALATYPLGRFVLMPGKAGPDTLCLIDIRYWTFIFMILTVVMLAVVALFQGP